MVEGRSTDEIFEEIFLRMDEKKSLTGIDKIKLIKKIQHQLEKMN